MSCQQFTLYAAEGGVPLGREFAAAADAQTFVDQMRETAVWRRQYTRVRRVEVRWLESGKASSSAWFPESGAGAVQMLPEHRRELILCHEVAHVLAAARYGSRSHDPWFARTYLELVYSAMGSDAYSALHAAFERAGVQHSHDSCVPAGRESAPARFSA